MQPIQAAHKNSKFLINFSTPLSLILAPFTSLVTRDTSSPSRVGDDEEGRAESSSQNLTVV